MSAESVIQYPTVQSFISARAQSRVMRIEPRCYGISSDALALYGVKGGPEPTERDYPSDRWDLAACERTYLMAPDEVRARMLPVLSFYAFVWSLCRAASRADAVAQTRCGTDVSGVTDGKIADTTKAVPSGAANAVGDLTGAPPDITRKDHGYAGF